jgi:hypothetical protein
MQKLMNQMLPAGASAYYSAKWLSVLEDNIEYLKRHKNTVYLEVQLDVQVRYLKDPITMFSYLSIPLHMHVVNMRVNGWQKPDDFNKTVAGIYVVSPDTVDQLKRLSGI